MREVKIRGRPRMNSGLPRVRTNAGVEAGAMTLNREGCKSKGCKSWAVGVLREVARSRGPGIQFPTRQRSK